jgi:hypothetical protein
MAGNVGQRHGRSNFPKFDVGVIGNDVGLRSHANDFLDQEDGLRTRLKQDRGINNRGRVANALFWGGEFLLRKLLELHVEEPFVDLDARKTSFLHGLPTHFPVPGASQLMEKCT